MRKVLVLHGGLSAERDVSLNSGAAVAKGLSEAGYEVELLDYQGDVCQLIERDYDVAFIALHGRGGEDGVIQGVFEALGKPYTGSGVMASSLCMDKIRTKKLLIADNIATAKFCMLTADSKFAQLIDEMGPLFVKPAEEGSSIGLGSARNEQELREAYINAAQHDSPVMAEQLIDGPEYTVAVLNGEALPPIRMNAAGEFYDYEAKYLSDDTEYLIPCGLSDDEIKQIQRMALAACDATGIKTWARVDLMRNSNKQFFVLEVNTVPGMTDHSLVPMAAAANGISFSQLVATIVEGAFDG